MKNQYFGDVNDYLKYGLLRVLTRETGLRIAVGWMLTPDDAGADGRKTAYLDRTGWRGYDPPLFDLLRDAVQQGRRDVGALEASGLLPGARYHSEILGDALLPRRDYFERLAACAEECDLVFLDPDNGMEVCSRPMGRRGSSKYLYWKEARHLAEMGKSLVVFQHFARVQREAFSAGLRRRFALETGAEWVGVLATSNVAYFVAPAPAHAEVLRVACREACRQWQPHVREVRPDGDPTAHEEYVNIHEHSIAPDPACLHPAEVVPYARTFPGVMP